MFVGFAFSSSTIREAKRGVKTWCKGIGSMGLVCLPAS